jgi:hypothetical protein
MENSHHSSGASSTEYTEYEEQLVEFSEGGTEYEVVTEYVEEEVSESQNLEQMEVIEELAEVKADTGTYEEEEEEEELLPPPSQTSISQVPIRLHHPKGYSAHVEAPPKIPHHLLWPAKAQEVDPSHLNGRLPGNRPQLSTFYHKEAGAINPYPPSRSAGDAETKQGFI